METWHQVIEDGVGSYQELRDLGLYSGPDLDTRVFINRYLLDVIVKAGACSPIGRQFIPDVAENIVQPMEMVDSLCEDKHSHGALIHKYPDRALLYVSGNCAGLCRFCTRKRRVLSTAGFGTDSSDHLDAALRYLQKHTEITDLLLSGGDPFLLSDDQLAGILAKLKTVQHLRNVRIGTRTPSSLPQRITPTLCALLRRFNIKYVNTHFNHPAEVTVDAVKAIGRLRRAGINLGCQTVLLKGVNDDVATMRELMTKLYHNGVRPYYVYHADLVTGISHFRTTLRKGMEVMRGLQGWISGPAVPRYVFDSPIGKVPVSPDYIRESSPGIYEIKDYQGRVITYAEGEDTSS